MRRALPAEVQCEVCGDYAWGVAMAGEVKDDDPHLLEVCNGCLQEMAKAASSPCRVVPLVSHDIPGPQVQPAQWKANYGPDWPDIRASIIERDGNQCQDESHKAAGGSSPRDNIVVHHIKPLRAFNGDYNAANVPENLITLCKICHGRWHARLDREAKAAAR